MKLVTEMSHDVILLIFHNFHQDLTQINGNFFCHNILVYWHYWQSWLILIKISSIRDTYTIQCRLHWKSWKICIIRWLLSQGHKRQSIHLIYACKLYVNQLEKLEAAKAAWLVSLSILSLTRPYWALLNLTGRYWTLLDLIESYWALLGLILHLRTD